MTETPHSSKDMFPDSEREPGLRELCRSIDRKATGYRCDLPEGHAPPHESVQRWTW